MDISGLVIRIVFLLLPGGVASTFYRKLRGRRERKDWEDILEVIIFSALSYVLYAFVVSILNWFGSTRGYEIIKFTAFTAFFDEKAELHWHEVLIATVIGTILSFIASYVYTKGLINRLGQWLGVTSHFGEEDIWTIFNNDPSAEWVFVRDLKNDLAYRCWVQYYSDPYKQRELLLRNADVYVNSTGVFLYQRPAIYISANHNELTIEVPVLSNIPEGGEQDASKAADTERDQLESGGSAREGG